MLGKKIAAILFILYADGGNNYFRTDLTLSKDHKSYQNTKESHYRGDMTTDVVTVRCLQ